ncbi:MAG: hypothetical protein SVV03_03720 [Candidatus Nanohaloarchaea archaeon]|nr:hypothetical protein [Candidatus Nanohaloarchaea archaeon]
MTDKTQDRDKDSRKSDRKLEKVEIPRSEQDVKTDRAVIRKDLKFPKMHPDFPDTHNYLKQSLKYLDRIQKDINSLGKKDEEQVTFRRAERRGGQGISASQLEDSSEYRRRRIINRAINLVKQDLRNKGYSNQFIWDHHRLIEKKVKEFLKE